MSADEEKPPVFEVVPDDGERPEPIILHTSQGTLSVAADLTPEEFEILDALRRQAARRKS